LAVDPDHWLFRLSAEAWSQAAAVELSQGEAKIASRRTAITHARRAAGMALNGLLVAFAQSTGEREAATQRWGRSYIDHLRALGSDDDLSPLGLPPTAATAARDLLAVPVMGGQGLVQLGAAPHAAAQRSLELASQLSTAAAAAIRSLEATTAAKGPRSG